MFLNELFPNKCKICEKGIVFNKLICGSCEDSLFQPSYLERNGHKIYFAGIYEKPLSDFIIEFKFKQNVHFAKIFAKMIYKTYIYYNISFDEFPEILYLLSIKKHLKVRGYNPVYLIAKEFSKLTGFKINKGLKIKNNYSESQVEAENYIQRLKQVKNKFEFNSMNGTYILLDDVYTTGATISEAINTISGKIIPIILCKNVKK